MTEEEQLEFEELGRTTFRLRCDEVFYKNASACGSKGPHYAKCVRKFKDHKGVCEGMGHDDWGPRYEAWKRKSYVEGVSLPFERRMI